MKTEERKPIEDLRKEAVRGVRAREFLESPIWKEHFAPFLKKREVELGVGALWRPGDKNTIDAVALGCAFNGGRQAQIVDVLEELDVWVKTGEYASEELKKREAEPQ